jgi:hypothetical protein
MADFLFPNFHFGRILMFANLTVWYLNYVSMFHFFGNPIEDAIFMDKSNTSRAFAERNQRERGLVAYSTTSLFALRIQLHFAGIEVHDKIIIVVFNHSMPKIS